MGKCVFRRMVQTEDINLGDTRISLGLPWWLRRKESACNARDRGSIPGSRRSPGEGNGNPLQYSYLGNPIILNIISEYRIGIYCGLSE